MFLFLYGCGKESKFQNKQLFIANSLTSEEMDSLAQTVTWSQLQKDNLFQSKSYIKKEVANKEISLYNLRNSVEFNFGILKLSRIMVSKNYKFKILYLSYLYRMPSLEYCLAISNQGDRYFLSGYDKNEFRYLLKDRIKKVGSKDEALKTANLYLNTIEGIGKSEIVDTNNINSFLKQSGKYKYYKHIKPIKIKYSNRKYFIAAPVFSKTMEGIGKTLGYIALGVSATKLADHPSWTNATEFGFNLGLTFLDTGNPYVLGASIGFGVISATGLDDKVLNQLYNEK